MIWRRRNLEGFLKIDHRNSPGVPEAVTAAMGMPALPGGQAMECATVTCSHCTTVVILNPNRTRERHYCPSCDDYICDACHAIRHQTLTCQSLERRIEALIKSVGA